ncbi:hypothetical protein KP509_24G032400 [Ceratopteris richardii]|uniref:Cytochrome P450 n=1 Tax=Ceratopteris richardii TaxID=49495 RepID=A0A8T2RWP2_CERRI|nr:hypothetical protein KP509_24G032400 [Ceratopteris richardii]
MFKFVRKSIYRDHFAYSIGFQVRYVLRDPEQARELLVGKAGHFIKPKGRPDAQDLIGGSVASLEGEKWAQHRRILSNAFFLEKLKDMVPRVVALTTAMMKDWEHRIAEAPTVDVAKEFRTLTADVIAHTAFGTSYAEGKMVFEIQHKQQELVAKLLSSVYIPGSRFLPTEQNRYRNKLNRELRRILGDIVQKRMESSEARNGDGKHANDLLGVLLAANKGELHGPQKNLTLTLNEIISECKTFFFAGHDTTSSLLTFTFLLLGTHTEWQERLREEVFQVCGKTQLPTAESLNHLKYVNMVLNESLRLYPAAPAMFRETYKDTQLGETVVPAGTVIVVPIIMWHQDERFWGLDANEFRPDRFEEGISKACKVPGAYLPFSMGPRVCIGQTFAIIEAKIVLCTILQHYRFRLSPEYVHAPMTVFTLRPKFGMPIIFEKLT